MDNFSIFFGCLFIFVIVILICREIYYWYTKASKQVELLEDIRNLLEDIKQNTNKKPRVL